MNFQFFEGLSETEAELYLERFLTSGREALGWLTQEASRRGIDADLSVASVTPVFGWLTGLASSVPLEPDPSLPEWIRPAPGPVITGFRFSMELPVLLVSENLFARAFTADPMAPDVRGVVAFWEGKSPLPQATALPGASKPKNDPEASHPRRYYRRHGVLRQLAHSRMRGGSVRSA